jgi:CheY-like chemotaxis protein
MLAVSDAGFGMDKETQARIFEPFFTTKEIGKGTGLGLSTAYGIVKQSGGNIWVYSEPGRGTTFKIYLPLVDEVAAPIKKSEPFTEPTMGVEIILLVEDEEIVRKFTREILELNGYKVIEATGGEEALRIAQEFDEKIDLLLTDVVMPQIGGRALANAIGITRPDIKVLYLSGYTDETMVQHGLLERATAFLQKPFTPQMLASKVREVLDEKIEPDPQ